MATNLSGLLGRLPDLEVRRAALFRAVLAQTTSARSFPVNTLKKAMPDTAILLSFKPAQRTRVRRVHERGHYDREIGIRHP